MKIECPSCSTINQIDCAQHITCSSCKKSFKDHTYKKFKKPFISATTALAIGVSGTYYLDKHWLETNRYPILVEHEIMNACVSGSSKVLDIKIYEQKTKNCSCALHKTMKEINYSEFKKSDSKFLSRFNKEILNCY